MVMNYLEFIRLLPKTSKLLCRLTLLYSFLFVRKMFGQKFYYFNLILYLLLLINFTTLILITQDRHVYRRITKVSIIGLETNRLPISTNTTSTITSPLATSDANLTLNQNQSNSTTSSASNVFTVLVHKPNSMLSYLVLNFQAILSLSAVVED